MNDSRQPVSAMAAGEHLTPRGTHGWSFWRAVECRTAGFPVTLATGFADPACSLAADRCNEAVRDAEQRWEAVRSDVKQRIKTQLDVLRQLRDSAADTAALDAAIRSLRASVKLIDRRQTGQALGAQLEAEQYAQLCHAEDERQRHLACYTQAFAQAAQRSLDYATGLAASSRFREAVTWQNWEVLHKVLDVLADEHTGKTRRHRSEELVARYGQRYATKNDTIGFFGPVGWASIVYHAAPLRVEAGKSLLARRSVYFEDWAIQAVAAQLSTLAGMRPWCTPQRMPFLRIEGTTLYLPGNATQRLSAEEAALLRACDGRCTAQQIAAVLAMQPMLAFDGAHDVYALLEQLAAAQRISWGLVVRVGDAWPERHLRSQLEVISEPSLRQTALATLDRLVQAQHQVHAAAGDAVRVEQALAHLNATFETVTGHAAKRCAGETYGARTVVYEDCVRDMQVHLGWPLAERLQAALEPLLLSARWYCHRLAQRFNDTAAGIWQRTAAAAPGQERAVDFPTFWVHAQSLFFGEERLDCAALQAELAARWSALLAPAADARALQRSSAALGNTAREMFAAPDCGWRAACHHSPDVMIAAADSAAVCRGEFQFVLGELHLGLNTLINYSALNQAPSAQALLHMLKTDRGAPRILPIVSRAAARQPIRVQTVRDAGYDIELCFSHDARPLAPEHALQIGELEVVAAAEGLVVRTRDRKRQFALTEVFGEFLSGLAADQFRILAPAPRHPRITIDKLVIQRETWHFPCADLALFDAKDEAQCFREVRQWRAMQDMPRRVFVKLSWERKPFFIDFDSPLLVRMLAKQVRHARSLPTLSSARASFSEMLPTPDQAWLADAEDLRYTSELRLVAVHADDLAPSTGSASREPTI
ncbi:lantibiotic dehydratase [Massilia sp. erpn]|uniref:lantibiotic dehydratase n=1 Tax=Massilia sp. erpn TaxID=2738142 RepID=UPI002105F138|nr:lantibiotic dehydratase [Massilia sp. erpn]UTY57072.1 hypothetical protein HPQ68_07620 [Massilia sp. erpn]